MVYILLAVLFVSQLLSFFFIILLNMKIAKLKDLEGRQEKVFQEMDDAISVYLLEMKEENDRLIQEMKKIEKEQAMRSEMKPLFEQEIVPKSVIPPTLATTMYNKHVQSAVEIAPPISPAQTLTPFEAEVLQLYRQGMTIEDIAKQTQKGKTEIELLIKFHQEM